MNENRPPERLLRLQDVIERTSLGKTTIYKRIGEGAFPRPVSLGGQCVRWREVEIDDWIRSLSAAPPAAA